jgi:hypothetical protein
VVLGACVVGEAHLVALVDFGWIGALGARLYVGSQCLTEGFIVAFMSAPRISVDSFVRSDRARRSWGSDGALGAIGSLLAGPRDSVPLDTDPP